MQENKELDRLLIEGQNRLSMTGVSAVDGFSEQQIKLSVNGSKVLILGENIKITSFNKGTGNLTADGRFFSVKYDYKKQQLLKRFFK